jgi:uncharacterized protein YqjF (DUF2071 family)
MAMRWHDLLFAHWPVPAASLRSLIPPWLKIDTFGGTAWIAVVPFTMTGVRPRKLPAFPWIGAFAELNVRTYVTGPDGEHPGVWFSSLDAANPVAVRAARWSFHLPYFDARMASRDDGTGQIIYRSTRTHRLAAKAEFIGRYRPIGDAYTSRAGELDHWLTERYSLYSANPRGEVFRGDIHHIPWPLQPAQAHIRRNTMTDWLGITLPDTRPLLHFARFLDVRAWRLAKVRAAT